MYQLLQQRKLSVGEMLAMSVEVLKQNFRSVLWISIVFYLPFLIIIGFISEKAYSLLDVINASLAIGSLANMHLMGKVWLYIGAMLLISMLILPIGDMALSLITKKTLLNEKITSGKALTMAFEKGPSLILASIVYTLCVGICMILVIPGLYLAITWCFFTTAIAIDDKTALESLFYSQKLVKGRWWETFGIFFLIGIVVQIFSMVLLWVLTLAGGNLVMNIIHSIIVYGINIFLVLFYTLFYYNRRFLVEGPERPEIPEENETLDRP